MTAPAARNLTLIAMAALGACAEPSFDNYLAASEGQPRTTSAWSSYGGPGAAKFASLQQIDKNNVDQLQLAWTYRTGDVDTVFQNTPVLIDGQLVLCTPRNHVIALDPLTGAELWRFDAEIWDGSYGNQTNCRSVAQWHSADAEECPARILMATNDARLMALDARTGQICASFGEHGEVDLKAGVGALAWPGEYQVASPPAVVNDIVVVGASISDNQRIDAPSGVVRGYHAATGELAWAFDFAPPDFDYDQHPVSDAGYALATPNVWAPMAVDAARDLVFLPTGNPAPDYYRDFAPDMDFYGSAVVALKASTGEYVWHFNTVINDFWDFDVPSAPSLADLNLDGQSVPALIQSTKMGFIFVLHRETGKPLLEVSYQDVPQHGPLKDYLSPVQPFPPPAFQVSRSYQAGESLMGLCDAEEQDSVIGPIYTPITEQWTIGLPSNMGATNWGGVAVDGTRGLIAVRTNSVPFRTKLIPREQVADLLAQLDAAPPADRRAIWGQVRSRLNLSDDVELARQRGTDYLMARAVFLDSTIGLPCAGTPLGEMMVLDVNAQRQTWRRPHGTTKDITGIGFELGMAGVGGPMMTSAGLIFAAGVAESAIRAYDVDSGEELWRHRLPFPGNATPMSYTVQTDGEARQFIVIAAGGDQRGGIGGLGDYLVAFALPAKD